VARIEEADKTQAIAQATTAVVDGTVMAQWR
jgi:hypothetical protein